MKKILVALVLLLTTGLMASCGSSEPEELTKVVMMLDWVPNTNHTGIYVALEKGYFEDAGLDVQIIQPGDVYAEAAVAGGSADFGISFQEQITLARAEDVPIVSVATIFQHNTSGFVSAVDQNITRPRDFEGKTYGAFGSPFEMPTLEVLMACDGGDVDNLNIVDTGWADPLALIEEGQIDIAWIYYGWEGFQAEQQGLDLNVVMMEDYFDCIPNYYTPVVITSEDTIADDSELVATFIGALSKGYEFCVENPDEAADILVAAVPEYNTELVRASMEWLAYYYIGGAEQWGEQEEWVWISYTDWMLENGILETPITVTDAFTNEFLP